VSKILTKYFSGEYKGKVVLLLY